MWRIVILIVNEKEGRTYVFSRSARFAANRAPGRVRGLPPKGEVQRFRPPHLSKKLAVIHFITHAKSHFSHSTRQTPPHKDFALVPRKPGGGSKGGNCHSLLSPDARGARQHTTTTTTMGQKQSKRGEGSSLKSASCGSRRDDDRTTSCSSETLRGVLQSLHRAGLKGTCKVSVAIGFGATNRESGRKTFPKLRSLHSVHPRCKRLTPYEEVIVCLSRSLEALARPNEVAAYGFGDERSDESPPQVFPFLKASRPLEDFDELHRRYRFIAQHVRLGQTSSIAPVIRNAIDETAAGGLQFHVLVIVADALHSNPSQDSASSARKVKESSSVSLLRQFSSKKHKLGSDPSSGRSRYSSCGSISPKFIEEAVTESRREEEIERAIVEASRYPISIIFVGVGDGGREFREAKEKFARKRFPGQLFPNFSFVDYR